MIEALNDSDSIVRYNAALALAACGSQAKIAIQQLLALKDATNSDERICVRAAIKQIEPQAARSAGLE